MVALIWLYDTIVNDTSLRRVNACLWTLRPFIIYFYPSQPFWLDRLFQYQYTVYVLPLLSSQGYVSLSFKLCVCLDEHLFLFALVENFLGGMTIMSVAAVDPQHHIGWTMALAASGLIGIKFPQRSVMILYLTLNWSGSRRFCLRRIEGNDTYFWALILNVSLEVTRSAHCWWTIDLFLV